MVALGILVLAGVIVVAIFLLKGFDRISGRGPKQVSEGIQRAKRGRPKSVRVPCPECAELVMPAAKKCRFCGFDLQ